MDGSRISIVKRLLGCLAMVVVCLLASGEAKAQHTIFRLGVHTNGKILSALPSMNDLSHSLYATGDCTVWKETLISPVLKSHVGLKDIKITCDKTMNEVQLPYGPNVKILTINEQGEELYPRPILFENDEIFIVIVNLKTSDSNKYILNYINKDLQLNYNRIFSATISSSTTSGSELNNSIKSFLNLEPDGSATLTYTSKVLYLGSFQGIAGESSEAITVNYEIKKCGPDVTPDKCVPFAGVVLNPGTVASKKPDKPRDPQDDDTASSKPKPNTETPTPGVITSNMSLRINNIYRFHMMGGYVMSGFKPEEIEHGSNLSPVIGLAVHLGPEWSPAYEPGLISLDRWSVWMGFGIPNEDYDVMDNFFVGMNYQVYQGFYLTGGVNYRAITEHVDHDPDNDTYTDYKYSWFTGLTLDLDVFTKALIEVPATVIKQWQTSFSLPEAADGGAAGK